MKTLPLCNRRLLPLGLLGAALTTHGLGCTKPAPSFPNPSTKRHRDRRPEPIPDTIRPTIGEDKAIELALKNYKQIFGELASRGESSGEWVQLVAPTRERFVVTQTPSTWEPVHDGNAGLVAHAKVDKRSGLVEWSLVAFAHE